MIFGLFRFDWTILLLVPGILFAIWAQIKVQSTYKKYSSYPTRRGMTGAQAARRILDQNGLSHVRIEHIRGHLNDHFDPRANVIRLSDAVHDSASPAAIGVAAHEAGHAVQYAKKYLPMKFRALIIPATRFGSVMAIPLFFIGLIFAYEPLMLAGILLYATIALFQLATLPVEFNASRRAMVTLRGSGMMNEDELGAAREVLTAAALTYVAALVSSLLTLLRLVILAGGRRRD